jgi:hypothetical protein
MSQHRLTLCKSDAGTLIMGYLGLYIDIGSSMDGRELKRTSILGMEQQGIRCLMQTLEMWVARDCKIRSV